MALLETLNEHFGEGNVAAVGDRGDLFCAYRRSSAGAVYQVIYIDASEAWLQAGLEAYFEDVLSQAYYTSEAYLQWNFYYYFVAQEALIREHNDIRRAVENNEAFARKFVLTEADLLARLRAAATIGQRGGQLDGGDLYMEWLNYLREQELNFVYDDQNYPNYKSWVEQYVDGRPFLPPPDASTGNTTGGAPHIHNINRLEIEQFRRQPVQRDFAFGRVNLISGANASGKTSFFDTLEFCLTGKAKNADGEGYRLRLTANDGLEIPYPDASATYRQRDISWYKSVNTRGHNLVNNFNKFNYFASDAAFILKTEDDDGQNEIERTITNIAIGREINRLEERVTEFRSRFDAQLDALNRSGADIRGELEKLARNAEEVQAASTDTSAYRAALMAYLDEHHWLIDAADEDELIAVVAAALELVNKAYQDLVVQLPASGEERPEEIDAEIERLSGKVAQLEQFKEDLDTAQRFYGQLQEASARVNAAANTVERLHLYFADPDLDLLPAIQEQVRAAEEKVTLLQKAGVCLSALVAFLQGQPKDTGQHRLMAYSEQLMNRRQEAQTARASAAGLADAIRHSVDELTRLIVDIKRLGAEFIASSPEADHCPLCDTPLLHEVLAERIGTTAAQFGDPEQYRVHQEAISRYEQVITETGRVLEDIDRLETLIPHGYLDAMAELTLGGLRVFWGGESALLPQSKAELSRLRAIRERFEARGLNPADFRTRQNELSGMLNIPVTNNDELEQGIAQLQQRSEDLDRDLQTQVGLIENIRSQGAAIFEAREPDAETLTNRLRQYRAAKASLTMIAGKTMVVIGQPVSVIHSNILGLTSVFTIYKDNWYAQKNRTEALTLLTRSRQDAEERRRSNQATTIRVNEVIAKLDHLLIERSKLQYLDHFIQANKQEIVGIFRQIHSPLEFTDISFADNKVKLMDEAGNWHTINQVSTGQRTAVALSLFLSLNKKLPGGPDILLMDDPVTYVDDLNTLSFFDYLRELVEQSNRQLFFATANADVAFLFAKKFAYLGTEQFRQFAFKRLDQSAAASA